MLHFLKVAYSLWDFIWADEAVLASDQLLSVILVQAQPWHTICVLYLGCLKERRVVSWFALCWCLALALMISLPSPQDFSWVSAPLGNHSQQGGSSVLTCSTKAIPLCQASRFEYLKCCRWHSSAVALFVPPFVSEGPVKEQYLHQSWCFFPGGG